MCKTGVIKEIFVRKRRTIEGREKEVLRFESRAAYKSERAETRRGIKERKMQAAGAQSHEKGRTQLLASTKKKEGKNEPRKHMPPQTALQFKAQDLSFKQQQITNQTLWKI